MALNYSNLLTPNKNAINPLASTGTNPLQNALTNKANPQPIKPIAPNFQPIQGKPTYVPPPTLPVKNQTIVHPDGTKISHTFDTSSTSPTQPPTPPTTKPVNGNVQTPSGATVNSDTGGLVTQPPQSTTNPAYNTAKQGLINIGQNGSAGYNQAVQNLADFKRTEAQKFGNIESTPIPLVFQQGREQVLARQAASEESALQGAVTQQQTQQGQQISALGSLGSLGTQTVATPYGTPVYSFEQGGNVNGSTTGSTLSNAVNSAVQLVQNGASPNDPNVQALLSPFGIAGTQAFTNAQQQISNGTYNPTASGAISQQNVAQGQQYQAKATELGTTLGQLSGVTAPIMSLLNGAGLNQEQNPFFNQSINAYQSQLTNPAAQASLKAGMAEIKTYVASILGTGGDLTPTELTNLTTSFDPGNFTASQLSDFLSNLDNYGQVRLKGFQDTSSSSYGTNNNVQGSAPATPSANATIPPNNTPSSVTSDNPVVQGVVGGAINSLQGLISSIHGIASTIFD